MKSEQFWLCEKEKTQKFTNFHRNVKLFSFLFRIKLKIQLWKWKVELNHSERALFKCDWIFFTFAWFLKFKNSFIVNIKYEIQRIKKEIKLIKASNSNKEEKSQRKVSSWRIYMKEKIFRFVWYQITAYQVTQKPFTC